jgi:Family of unknown function (DUF6448)
MGAIFARALFRTLVDDGHGRRQPDAEYRPVLIAITAVGLLTLSSRPALAHCDTMDGPVVRDARVALDSRDVTPVLKWIAPGKEGEIREAFQHAVTGRALSAEARTLADRLFFETLVRVHREGEGRVIP